MSKQIYTLTLNSSIRAFYKRALKDLALVSIVEHFGLCLYCLKIFNRYCLIHTLFGIIYRSHHFALANISNFTENADIEFQIIAMRNNIHRYLHSRIFLVMSLCPLQDIRQPSEYTSFLFYMQKQSYSIPFIPRSFFNHKVYKGTRGKEENIKVIFPKILQTFCTLKYVFSLLDFWGGYL